MYFLFFQREVNYISGLIKYLFHTMCCTSDEEMRYASYNSAVYLLTTRCSLSYVKNELFLALVNLGRMHFLYFFICFA